MPYTYHRYHIPFAFSLLCHLRPQILKSVSSNRASFNLTFLLLTKIHIPPAPHNYTLTHIHSQYSLFSCCTKHSHQSTQLLLESATLLCYLHITTGSLETSHHSNVREKYLHVLYLLFYSMNLNPKNEFKDF